MTFSDELRAFTAKVERRQKAAFVGCAQAVHQSVVEGSPITGAPGQPVDTGNLRASWQLQFMSDTLAKTSTSVEYAPTIEQGRGPHGPITIRSQVGGIGSVALTRAGWQAIVNSVASRLTG
jgi:hypothetical protein